MRISNSSLTFINISYTISIKIGEQLASREIDSLLPYRSLNFIIYAVFLFIFDKILDKKFL